MFLVRRTTTADLPAILRLISRVVPRMQAARNFQWEADYPNKVVFRQDIERQRLWLGVLNGAVVGVAALTTGQDPEYAQAD